MRSYGMTKPLTGYYDDGSNLFYYNEADHSITLVATPGGGERWVFKREHNLYGPLYALLFTGGLPSFSDEAQGLDALKPLVPTVERTKGEPRPAPFYAWLDVLELQYADRKPLVLRPAFWATSAVGVAGVGYLIYFFRRKKA